MKKASNPTHLKATKGDIYKELMDKTDRDASHPHQPRPFANNQRDLDDGTPNMGRHESGKPNSGEPHKYRFAKTAVRDAMNIDGAALTAIETQGHKSTRKPKVLKSVDA